MAALVHVADADLAGRVVLVGGSVNARADASLFGQVVGAGTFSAVMIANAGQIVASGGTLVVQGSITGTGALGISPNATLDLAGAVASTQNVVFGAGANTLALGNLPGFAGHLFDFATGDAIDLLGHAATKLSYAAGVLSVSNGTTLVAKVQIRGSYTAANFKLGSDGHGGALVSYAATSAAQPHHVIDPIGFVGGQHFS